jgi:hypothetical protein
MSARLIVIFATLFCFLTESEFRRKPSFQFFSILLLRSFFLTRFDPVKTQVLYFSSQYQSSVFHSAPSPTVSPYDCPVSSPWRSSSPSLSSARSALSSELLLCSLSCYHVPWEAFPVRRFSIFCWAVPHAFQATLPQPHLAMTYYVFCDPDL